MSTYLQAVVAHLPQPTGSGLKDGASLAEACLAEVDFFRFPAKLLILWATPAFHPYHRLLQGVNQTISELKIGNPILIGASVAGCFVDDSVFTKGAVLVALCSRFIEARPAVAEHAQWKPRSAVSQLVSALSSKTEFRHSDFLMTFLPGHSDDVDPEKYMAADLIDEIKEQIDRRKLRMFGGVSSGGIKPSPGWQFLGDRVYQHAIVAALVSCDLAYGIAINHGLSPTRTFLTPEGVSPDRRKVLGFKENAVHLFRGTGDKKLLLGTTTASGEDIIYAPKIRKTVCEFFRPIPLDAKLQVFSPSSDSMARSLKLLERRVTSEFRIPRSVVCCTLSVACVGRYRDAGQGLRSPEIVNSLKPKGDGAQSIGCFMDGEVGTGRCNEGIFGNWSVAQLAVADDVPSQTELLRTVSVIARQLRSTAGGVAESMRDSLSLLRRFGYHGGMISLVLAQGDEKWLVASAAIRGVWQKKILPKTTRRFHSNDVLAIVAESKAPKLIVDATTDPASDCQLALSAGITSFIAFPLLNDKRETIGVLQIDLGDIRHVGRLIPEQEATLTAIASLVSVSLHRAIETEELVLSRRLDSALIDASECEDEQQALNQFIASAVDAIGGDGAYVRLYAPDSNVLNLAGGFGAYYDEALHARPCIAIDDIFSTTAAVAASKVPLLVNDTSADERLKKFRELYADTSIAKALAAVNSYVTFPLKDDDELIGIFNLHSHHPWFFTQSRLRSLSDIDQRLKMLIALARKQRLLRLNARVLAYVSDVLQMLGRHLSDPRASSDKNVGEIRAEKIIGLINNWLERRQTFFLKSASSLNIYYFFQETLSKYPHMFRVSLKGGRLEKMTQMVVDRELLSYGIQALLQAICSQREYAWGGECMVHFRVDEENGRYDIRIADRCATVDEQSDSDKADRSPLTEIDFRVARLCFELHGGDLKWMPRGRTFSATGWLPLRRPWKTLQVNHGTH